jgi:hypothetical protein
VQIKVQPVLRRGLSQPRLSQKWHADVQPVIAGVRQLDRNGQWRPRVDATWNWPAHIELCRAAGIWRSVRIYQMTVGPEDQPAAMICLLRDERWIDEGRSAVYLWYLSTAPDSLLSVMTIGGNTGVPGLLGLAVLDVGIVDSINAGWDGRLWLHSEPSGNLLGLPDWYAFAAGATRVSSGSHPWLPGVGGWTRENRTDDYYFAFTQETAQWLYRRMRSA